MTIKLNYIEALVSIGTALFTLYMSGSILAMALTGAFTALILGWKVGTSE